MDWFQAAKFGLFIHWGIYSVPAGRYQGHAVERRPGQPGTAEWIMHDAKIPVAEYARYATQFDPVKFDARAWVDIARQAGMKYIVITAKHHDGFAMFKSRASSFNVVDATPFGRDPLRELADACQQAGIKLGFYYSQAQDWSHPGGAAWGNAGPMIGGDPGAGRWGPAQAGDFDRYLDQVALPQVRELLTGYGPVAVLWWDTPVGMTAARAARFAPLLRLQPGMLTNNRLLDPDHANPYSGDTETPEQSIPATGIPGRRFEVCMTMNDTWGYKSDDRNWKSSEDILRKLIDIVSKGGNFLLNVGPDAQGEFPAASVERLRACGQWLQVNGAALYGTSASRFRRLSWGRSTTAGDTLYLEVFDWPTTGRLAVPGVRSHVTKASLLATGKELAVEPANDGIVVRVPRAAPDAVASVVRLDFDRAPTIDQPLPVADAAGSLTLPAALAAVVNSYTGNARLTGAGDGAYIAHWDRAGIAVTWSFGCERPGDWELEAEVRGAGQPVFGFGCPDPLNPSAPVKLSPEFRWIGLGRFAVARAGDQALSVKATGGHWTALELRRVRMRAVAPR